jgi:hypothetical protein
VDYGKHVTSANTITLAILALGFTALYAVWITSETEQTRHVYNRFEIILAARNALVERPWKDDAEVTVKNLTELSIIDSFLVSRYEALCKRIPTACEDEETQRESPFGLTLEEIPLKLPRVQRVELTGLRNMYTSSCSAIIFRGKEKEKFWINSISSVDRIPVSGSFMTYARPGLLRVPGSFIYYVRLSDDCNFAPGESSSSSEDAFFLIDLHTIGHGWHFYAQDNIIRDFYGDLYRMAMNDLKRIEDTYRANFPDASFEINRFFEQLPEKYRNYFTKSVPSTLHTTPVQGIEAKILKTVYIKTGTLYGSSEVDKAISAIYSFERLSPTVGGVGTNLHLFTTIAPILLLSFSFVSDHGVNSLKINRLIS